MFARNIKHSITRSTSTKNNSVVPLAQIFDSNICSNSDVAKEGEALALCYLSKIILTSFDILMIGCYAGANQTKRCGKRLNHINMNIVICTEQVFCCVKSRRTTANYADSEWRVG